MIWLQHRLTWQESYTSPSPFYCTYFCIRPFLECQRLSCSSSGSRAILGEAIVPDTFRQPIRTRIKIMHASCYIPSMILVLSIPSIFLLLAAPSMASSFVSKPSLKLQEIANGMHNGLTQRRRHYTGAAPYNSVLGIHPGGSSAEQEGSPSLSDDTVPSTSSSSLSASEVTDSGDGTTSPPQDSSLGPNASEPGVLRRSFPSLPWHRLPNMLTYIRCLAIPALVGIFYLPDSYRGTNIATGVIFGLASATDWLDGYLARRWDISSSFGAFLDPVADKLMVSTSLILLAGRFGQGTFWCHTSASSSRYPNF